MKGIGGIYNFEQNVGYVLEKTQIYHGLKLKQDLPSLTKCSCVLHGEKEQQENFVNNKSLPTSRYRTK
jgi:hypothetical protein